MKDIISVFRSTFSIFLGLIALPAYALAIPNPIDCDTFACVVQAATLIMVKIAIPLAAIFLIYAGFLFVSSRGNEQQLKSAKDVFWYTIIGTAIVVGAYAIASAVVGFATTFGN